MNRYDNVLTAVPEVVIACYPGAAELFWWLLSGENPIDHATVSPGSPH